VIWSLDLKYEALDLATAKSIAREVEVILEDSPLVVVLQGPFEVAPLVQVEDFDG
jgi:hypothetical protein